jgi:hypothetical protein
MNELDDLLQELGLHDQANRSQIKAEIFAYVIESAVAKLQEAGTLTEEEQSQLKEMFASDPPDFQALETVFASPERQLFIKAATTEALNIVATAAEPSKN